MMIGWEITVKVTFLAFEKPHDCSISHLPENFFSHKLLARQDPWNGGIKAYRNGHWIQGGTIPAGGTLHSETFCQTMWESPLPAGFLKNVKHCQATNQQVLQLRQI